MRYSHEKLMAYQKGLLLVKATFQITKDYKEHIPFFLHSQMTRSAVSYLSNIVEGVSRSSIKEKRRFIEIAYGSLVELDCQVVITQSIIPLKTPAFDDMRDQIEELIKITSGLKRSFKP